MATPEEVAAAHAKAAHVVDLGEMLFEKQIEKIRADDPSAQFVAIDTADGRYVVGSDRRSVHQAADKAFAADALVYVRGIYEVSPDIELVVCPTEIGVRDARDA